MGVVTTHELDCDVLVAGGGAAGVPCALAAARNGARVILCHDRPVLGGNASSEVRLSLLGADQWGRRGQAGAETREGGIVEEIRLENCVRNPQCSASMADLILFDTCRAERGLTLLLNTAVTGAELANGRLTHVVADRPSTEDRFHIAAEVLVDCTGDGRLGVEAGAAFRLGREGREEFGEPLAPVAADQLLLGSTLLFQARRLDRPVPFIAPRWARRFTEADLKLRPHHELDYGYWWVAWGGTRDTIKDNEAIRDELLAILLGVWDHIKNGGDHGADNWALEWFGFLPGKRESRRFSGQYVLRESDVLQSRPFPDAIAYGGWFIDLHPPAGVDGVTEHPAAMHPVPHLYDIPLRACVARDIPNLMFAGRNFSATHVAFASTRVMATCGVVGQGVGTAAAHAVQHRLAPAELAADPSALHAIQQRLLRDDAYLIGIRHTDPLDRAPCARISAASEQPDGAAANVVSGQTRSVHQAHGAPPDRARPGAHRWLSRPADGLPVWLELRWEQPIRPREIQLVFDTGLSRQLTLSHSAVSAERMGWGRAQPETVRDYCIEFEANGSWQSVVTERNNYQRRRVHTVATAGAVAALRLTITATNGADHARLCEVRVYE